jgi:uncharacterized protein (DUF58 family)
MSGYRPLAMKRAAVSGFLAAALLAVGVAAVAAAPVPTVKLETRTEKEALSKGHIKVRVKTPKPTRVRARAKFSAGVSPNFRIDPVTKPVDRDGTGFRFELSKKQRRLIAAAIDVCAPADVTVKSRALGLPDRPASKLKAVLEAPDDC